MSRVVPLLVLLSATVLLGAGVFHLRRAESTSSVPVHVLEAFKKWQVQYQRLHATPEEFKFRLQTFYQNFLKIEQMKQSKISFEVALNKFGDWTHEEIKSKYMNLKEPKKRSNKPEFVAPKAEGLQQSIPEWVDWRAKGAVNPIQDQARCGSCWAFTGLVAVEGAWVVSGRTLEKFSEQQLVDCADEYGAEGCGGGWMEYVYDYIIGQGGIQRASDYPYVATPNKCKADKSKFIGKLKDYLHIPAGDCRSMTIALTYNTLASAIDAGYMPFYKSGVYDYPHCGDSLNHGVSIIGYGTDWANGKQYWTVRNSFGEDWGEGGYIRMDRNVQTNTGLCGLCKRASFPLAADK